MSLFLSLLPLFIFGNVHCAGMCGPLVMLLARHRYRWWYFLGRLVSFTLAGLMSAEVGMVLFSFLSRYRISAAFSFLFGIWIVAIGVMVLFNVRLLGTGWLAKKMAKFSGKLALLMTQHSFYGVFLFGASTLLLPCGQTLIVFSIIALQGTPITGLLNGMLFALFTSPALIAVMHASTLFSSKQKRYHLWVGSVTLSIGLLSLLRGCADCGFIPHVILNPHSPPPSTWLFFN